GLPGDNFSLQGALDLFKTANTLEDSEKKINDESGNQMIRKSSRAISKPSWC
ncbi:MAG: hypothetical protein RLZZ613_256, partial [Pseudomonadota bacterium]